jgi:hypothetical protein
LIGRTSTTIWSISATSRSTRRPHANRRSTARYGRRCKQGRRRLLARSLNFETQIYVTPLCAARPEAPQGNRAYCSAKARRRTSSRTPFLATSTIWERASLRSRRVFRQNTPVDAFEITPVHHAPADGSSALLTLLARIADEGPAFWRAAMPPADAPTLTGFPKKSQRQSRAVQSIPDETTRLPVPLQERRTLRRFLMAALAPLTSSTFIVLQRGRLAARRAYSCLASGRVVSLLLP